MRKKYFISLLLLLALITVPLFAGNFDYATALRYAILFYDANRCGPDAGVDNVFDWRGLLSPE